MTLDEFMDILTLDDCINLLGGQPNTGCANTFGMGNLPEYGVPNVMTADGPAGLRILPKCGVNTTAWPCATLLASTWDEELVEKVGKAGAEEVKENNLYQKNVLREISSKQPVSPIHIEKKEEYIARENLDNFDFNSVNYDNGLGMTYEDPNISPLEEMEDAYEVNDNMKFASEIVEKMEEETKPSNIELTDYEKKQEEEAIISYDELMKVKDKIYNITYDEETDEFIDELKNFRLDL